jgi:purine-nucleoside phosphorylase
METAPLYAAAAACGVRSLWLGHVSDSLLDDGAWDSWHRPAACTDVTVELLVAFLGDLAGRRL